MRGLWCEGGRLRHRGDLPEPEPAVGEVRVAVRLVGLCATDLALARGYLGFEGVPGHEFVGQALEGPLAGRRVVGEINAGCGRCLRCRSGDPRHCEQRSVLGILARPGAFAERLCLPAGNLLAVDDRIPDEWAVFAEPLAAALALEQHLMLLSAPLVGERVALVIGDGKLGLLCAHALAAWHPEGRVDLLGRHPERAAWVGPGARHLGRPLGPGPAAARYPLVIEASGRPEALPWALPWVEPRGSLVLKSTAERPAEVDLAPIVIDELRLSGSRCGRLSQALDWMAAGRFDPGALIERRWPLHQGPEAFERAAQGGVLKQLIAITA